MRKFKHKTTGFIAEELQGRPKGEEAYCVTTDTGRPVVETWIIEGSLDWQEVLDAGVSPAKPDLNQKFPQYFKIRYSPEIIEWMELNFPRHEGSHFKSETTFRGEKPEEKRHPFSTGSAATKQKPCLSQEGIAAILKQIPLFSLKQGALLKDTIDTIFPTIAGFEIKFSEKMMVDYGKYLIEKWGNIDLSKFNDKTGEIELREWMNQYQK